MQKYTEWFYKGYKLVAIRFSILIHTWYGNIMCDNTYQGCLYDKSSMVIHDSMIVSLLLVDMV